MNYVEIILLLVSEYVGSFYLEILENVVSKEVFVDLFVYLKNELNWFFLKILEYDFEMKIWDVNWEFYKMERWDEDLR